MVGWQRAIYITLHTTHHRGGVSVFVDGRGRMAANIIDDHGGIDSSSRL